MIETLLSDDIILKVGGRFRLTSLIQKRMLELNQGARPMIDRRAGMTDMEVAIEEIREGKLDIDYEKSDVDKEMDQTRM
jgi:DNA-directed RNA polymerase subunit omega